MRNVVLGGRYAKALIDLAVETNQLEIVYKDIEALRAVTHVELRRVLGSPIIRGRQKNKIFNLIFGDRISNLTKSFFNLVFEKGREVALPDILDAFEEQYRKLKGIVIVKLTTAVPVSDELREDIRLRFKSRPMAAGKEIILEAKVDERIGGFIAQMGDQLYDASIRHDLQYIKKQFVDNIYVSKIR